MCEADEQPNQPLFTPNPTLAQAFKDQLQGLSEVEGSDRDHFTDDLAQLADLTGRHESESQRTMRRKEDRRSILIQEANRDQSRFQFSLPGPTREVPAGGSMDDLVKEIKQMTIKKPDPYVSLVSYEICEVPDETE